MVTLTPDKNKISVQIELSEGDLGLRETRILRLDSKTGLSELPATVGQVLGFPSGCDTEVVIPKSHAQLTVSDEKPSYNPQSDNGLSIHPAQPLVEYFKQYRTFHGIGQRNGPASKSTISYFNNQDTYGQRQTTVEIGSAHLTFHRTLRVSDNDNASALPPSLGTFPLEPAEQYTENLSSAMKARGGVLMPILQREAMWIDFQGSSECAVKISVGGVNAITGYPQDRSASGSCTQDYLALPSQPWLDGIYTEPEVVRQFVAMPLGHGYSIEEKVTGRAEIGGIQIDIYPSFNDVVSFECEGFVSNFGLPVLDMSLLPGQLQIPVGNVISMVTKSAPCITLEDYANRMSAVPTIRVRYGLGPIRVMVVTTDDRRHSVPVSSSTTIAQLRALVQGQDLSDYLEVTYEGNLIYVMRPQENEQMHSDNSPSLGTLCIPTGAVLSFNYPTIVSGRKRNSQERELDKESESESDFDEEEDCDFKCGDSFEMEHEISEIADTQTEQRRKKRSRGAIGIAAGGKIEQRIYPDSNPAALYDEDFAERLWIHTVSSEVWEDITGVLPPLSTITPEVYEIYDYAWFKLYDEYKGSLAPTGVFEDIESVRALDNSSASEITPSGVSLFDPKAPPPCTCHSLSISSCVLRPCSHTACDACIEKSRESAKCPHCDEMVDAFVGFKQPIKLDVGGGSTGEWQKTEKQIESSTPSNRDVITVILQEDSFIHLHGMER